MKIKHLILVGLLLAVLTIGAVSASEDVASDNMTADDGGADIVEAPVNDAVPTDDVVGEDFDGEDFSGEVEDELPLDSDEDAVYIDFEGEPVGEFNITVASGENTWYVPYEITSDDRDDEGVGFGLDALGITEVGTYIISAKFIPVSGPQQSVFSNMQLKVTEAEGEEGETTSHSIAIDNENKTVTVTIPDNFEGSFLVCLDDDSTTLLDEIFDNLTPKSEEAGAKIYVLTYDELKFADYVDEIVELYIMDDNDDEKMTVSYQICSGENGIYLGKNENIFPVIGFNEEFYREDDSFVVVELPVEETDGRIVVYVDSIEVFNKTLDQFENVTHPPHDDNESLWAYAIGLDDLDFTFAADESYEFSVEVYLNGTMTYSSSVDEEINEGSSPEPTLEDVDYVEAIPEWGVVVDEAADNYIGVFIYDSDVTGRIIILVNDVEVYNQTVIPYDSVNDAPGENLICVADLTLNYGDNDITILYTGDDQYQSFEETGILNYYFIDVVPSAEDELWDTNSYLEIRLTKNATGNVEVFIDDVSYCNLTAEEVFDDGYVYIRDLEYGPHTYKVTYTGDENYTLDYPFEGEFNYTYSFYAYVDNDVEYIFFDTPVLLYIGYPSDAEGQLTINYNGRTTIMPTSEDDEILVKLTDLDVGQNIITVIYEDSKYPTRSIDLTVDIYARLTVPSTIRYNNEEDQITLTLPSDAEGNLLIFRLGEWNDVLNDYERVIIKSIPVKDGKASYLVNEWGLGDFEISVCYDGDDYEDHVVIDPYYGGYMTVVPDVQMELYIYVDSENSIKVVLPDDVADNLTVTVRSLDGEWNGDDVIYNYDKELYNAVANGTVTIPLEKMDVGEYIAHVTYGDDYDETFTFEVRGTVPKFDLNITFPSEITPENNRISISNVPDDIDGKFDLYIDGELFEEGIFTDEDDLFSPNIGYYLDYEEYGNHTWEIIFHSDSYYQNASASGVFFRDWLDVSSEIYSDESLSVYLEDKEGYVELKIDGEFYAIEILDDGVASFSLDDLELGNHTYEITYYDNNNTKVYSKQGSFNVDYYLSTNIYEDSEYMWVEEFYLDVYVPGDATANVTVNVDGKVYTAAAVDGVASIILKDLIVGENNVTVTYPGDDKYPAKELKEVINITGYGFDVVYSGEDDEFFESISLLLPSDADGNITIYVAKFVEEYEDYDGDGDEIYIPEHWEIDYDAPIVMSVKLKDGFAKITVADFDFGVYDLIAKYESPSYDYEVYDVDFHFDIVPEINITDEIVLGENATILVIIPNATGNLLVYKAIGENEDGDAIWTLFETIASDGGKFEKEIAGLGFGDHMFYFEYAGDDRPNMLNNHSYYYVTVTPVNVTFPEEFDVNGSGEITFILPDIANGKISVSVEYYAWEMGEYVYLIENATYGPANKTIKITGLPTGYNALYVEYVDDNYGEYDAYGRVYVPRPETNVEVSENITGDTFDVVLPKNATGGVLVTVDGESTYVPIVNGTANVDVSSLPAGEHNVSVKYVGNDDVKGFDKTFTVNKTSEPKVNPSGNGTNSSGNGTNTTGNGTDVVPPVDSNTTVPAKIVAKNLKAYYDNVKYSVKVYGTDGKVAAGVKVVFLINGKKIGTAKTNKKGVATIKVKMTPKTYKITSKALGVKVTKKLTVKQVLKLKKVKVKKSAKKLVLKATLKQGKKALRGKKVTFKFNGKKIKTVKTNKKGVAKVTIKKKLLKKLKVGKKVKYQATYKKVTVKKSIKVKK